MEASRAFYNLLGFEISGDDDFANAVVSGGGSIAFGSHALSRRYDPDFRQPAGGVPASSLQFAFPSRADVDATFNRLVAAGYHGSLPPFDEFWRNRYAEVDDPDGNIVGLQGSDA